jgi:hypothetical protein
MHLHDHIAVVVVTKKRYSLSRGTRVFPPQVFNHGDGAIAMAGLGWGISKAYLPRRSAFSAVSISSRMRARRLAGMGAVGPKLM